MVLLLVGVVGQLWLLEGLCVDARETGAHIIIGVGWSEALIKLLLLRLMLLGRHADDGRNLLLGDVLRLIHGSGRRGLLRLHVDGLLGSHLRLRVRDRLLREHLLLRGSKLLLLLRILRCLLPLLLWLHTVRLRAHRRAHVGCFLLRHVALRHGSLLKRLRGHGLLLHLRLHERLLLRNLGLVGLRSGTLRIVVQRLTVLVDLRLLVLRHLVRVLHGLLRLGRRPLLGRLLLLRGHGVIVREGTLRLMSLLLLLEWLHVILSLETFYGIKRLRRYVVLRVVRCRQILRISRIHLIIMSFCLVGYGCTGCDLVVLRWYKVCVISLSGALRISLVLQILIINYLGSWLF